MKMILKLPNSDIQNYNNFLMRGGRQLDGTISSIMALKNVINDVRTNLSFFLMEGDQVRKDIVKALALGLRRFYGKALSIWIRSIWTKRSRKGYRKF